MIENVRISLVKFLIRGQTPGFEYFSLTPHVDYLRFGTMFDWDLYLGTDLMHVDFCDIIVILLVISFFVHSESWMIYIHIIYVCKVECTKL